MHPTVDGCLCLHEGTLKERLMIVLSVMVRYRARMVMTGSLADI